MKKLIAVVLLFGILLASLVQAEVPLPIQQGEFRGAATVVTSTSTWTEIGRLRPRAMQGYVVFQGDVTVAALGGLKITRATTAGGTEVDWITDFTAASTEMPYNSGSPDVTAAGSSFQIKVSMAGAAEIVLYAKKASSNATVVVSGSIPTER